MGFSVVWIFFCVSLKTESHTGLQRHEGEVRSCHERRVTIQQLRLDFHHVMKHELQISLRFLVSAGSGSGLSVSADLDLGSDQMLCSVARVVRIYIN